LSLTKDFISKLWVVLVTGTPHVLYYSISKQQCLDYMSNVGK